MIYRANATIYLHATVIRPWLHKVETNVWGSRIMMVIWEKFGEIGRAPIPELCPLVWFDCWRIT